MAEKTPHQNITFPLPDSDVTDTGHGYLALPASGSGPGVIVIQEWWGLVDHIKDVCDRLADLGFSILATEGTADVPVNDLIAIIAAEGEDLVVFNGYADQYAARPLEATAGERVRVWVLDAGPNRPSSFHVIGSQFDRTWAEGKELILGAWWRELQMEQAEQGPQQEKAHG